MAEKKTGDPKDGAQHVGGGRFVPVALHGIGVVLPGPLTAGPPKPEPEEGWTLGPGHRPAAATGPDDGGPVEDRPPAEDLPVERVRPRVARPRPEPGEGDRD